MYHLDCRYMHIVIIMPYIGIWNFILIFLMENKRKLEKREWNIDMQAIGNTWKIPFP